MQFQVPQFIDTEDKVVGPFSIRQFLFIGIGAIISAIFYFFVATWLFVIAALVIMGASVALAFVKINGRPLVKVATAAFNFYWKPQTYIWKSEAPIATQAKAAPSRPSGFSLENMVAGMALHKSWENLQTGTPSPTEPKLPERQVVEKKMTQRYQVIQKLGGDRQAAKRVDYR
jgi:hypothetical protein